MLEYSQYSRINFMSLNTTHVPSRGLGAMLPFAYGSEFLV